MNEQSQNSSAGASHKRTRFMVLPAFQLRFMLYIVAFAAFGIVVMYISNHLYFERLISEGQQLGLAEDHIYFEFVSQQRSVLNTTFTLVSVIVFGGLFFAGLVLSHKIAGPIYRIQTYLQEIREQGKPSRPLKFRDGDFFPEVAELVEELVQQEKQD